MKKLESTDPRIQEAIVLYTSGKSVNAICKALHIDGSVMRRILKDEGILRTMSQAIRNAKSSAKVKDNVLDTLTEGSLYWIGFIYADGYIEKVPRARISLTLAEVDTNHLKKFNNFFSDGNLEIRDVTQKDNKAPGQVNFDGKHLRVAFSSKSIYNRLIDLGITNNKSLTLIPSKLLKDSKEFWRGVIDGDGWVCKTGDTRAEGKYNYDCIGLSGTENTITEFLSFLKDNNIETDAVAHKRKNSNVWQVDLHSKTAKKTMNLLYKDSTVYLDRKYQKYLELTKESINN